MKSVEAQSGRMSKKNFDKNEYSTDVPQSKTRIISNGHCPVSTIRFVGSDSCARKKDDKQIIAIRQMLDNTFLMQISILWETCYHKLNVNHKK